jgi:hypothetical protein
MSDKTQKACDAACRAAWDLVDSAVRGIVAEIHLGNVDPEDVFDAVNQAADDLCIYTADCFALVWGLREGEDAIEEGLCQPKRFSDALTAQAYCNARAAIESHPDIAAACERVRAAADACGGEVA